MLHSLQYCGRGPPQIKAMLGGQVRIFGRIFSECDERDISGDAISNSNLPDGAKIKRKAPV